VIGEHQLNRSSSRSHSIFTLSLEVSVVCESMSESVGRGVRHSKLHLVDLAGSERVSKTGSVGVVSLEARYINKSLSGLEQVPSSCSD
jgi:kinesin family member 6/9